MASSNAPSPQPQLDQHLIARMSKIGVQEASHNHHQPQQHYAPRYWNQGSAAPSKASSEALDNQALHGSPVTSGLQRTASSQSSPRAWESPEHLGPTPWEAATEQQLHNPYPGLDPQLSGYMYSGDSGMSAPYPADFVPSSGFDDPESGYSTSPGQGEFPPTPESAHLMSPCSTTLTMTMDDPPGSPGDDTVSQAATLVAQMGGSPRNNKTPPSMLHQDDQGDNDKNGEAYAKLIYKAFLSTPRHAMTLQEIYQWFRENTEKGKSGSKGWQNSIRHNLSMNHAFTRRDRRPSAGSISETGQSSAKKAAEWYLEPWAVAGVLSTTRYRNDNQARRAARRNGAHLNAQVYRPYHAPQHAHHPSLGRSRGRALRGSSRQSPRSHTFPMAGVATAAVHPQQAQHHQQLPTHAYHAFVPVRSTTYPQPHHHDVVLSDCSTPSPPPYSTASSAFFAPHHVGPNGMEPSSPTVKYEYPAEPLYLGHQHSHGYPGAMTSGPADTLLSAPAPVPSSRPGSTAPTATSAPSPTRATTPTTTTAALTDAMVSEPTTRAPSSSCSSSSSTSGSGDSANVFQDSMPYSTATAATHTAYHHHAHQHGYQHHQHQRSHPMQGGWYGQGPGY
ncbi:uncharacterized protein C8A04DRAFT_28313 [Dichotomopilus funicola]|uniref:Fork-head domain-containing protein n=1 Tax=Dichotomopilus funicola TaxID=1934379 RepID=A0AAN6V3B3_9PEZI|nr:hypothetical protein C8A04DRAFT_28313 [Dichotomopilus funicola]